MRPTRFRTFSALSLVLSLAATPAWAEDATAQQQSNGPDTGAEDGRDSTEGEILVIADALRGTVEAPQPPILELTTEDIAAYGVSSVADLIEALGPQVNSGRGRGSGPPAILVNGVRIASFRELRSYPPEAIEKVEVFPEEVALRYGFSADQRVVNFVLKRNYSSREVELEYGQPWEGGYSTKEAEATYLKLSGPSRFNVNLEWNDSGLLTEADRGVVQSTPPTYATDPDPARFRSLVSDSSELTAESTWTTKLADNGTSLTLNGGFERSDTLRLQGLDTVVLTAPGGASALRTLNEQRPLTVDSRTDTYSLGGALNAPLGDWQLTATVDGSRVDARSLIRRRADTQDLIDAAAAGALPIDAALPQLADAGVDTALTKTDSASSLVTITGSPLYAPAGPVSVTFDAGYDWTRIRSEDSRTEVDRTELKRGDLSAGVNLGVPITSVRDDFGAAIGDLSFNASAGLNHLSDFGTLTDWSAGLTWSPFDILTLTGSRIVKEAAPTLAQLGNPEIATPNVPVFDLTNGETVLATLITGGNPNLPAQKQQDWKFGAIVELPFLDRSNFSIDYFINHSEDVTSTFPVLTPAVEAAFPGRVVRDASGRLVSIDQRPVTYAAQDSQRLQFGLNLSGQIGKASEGGGGGGFMGRFGGAAAGGGQGGAGQGQSGGGGQANGEGRPGFDPAKLQALRQEFCAQSADGSTPTLTEEQLADLPPMLVQRLKREDGTIDPERVAQFRTRFCSNDGFGRGPASRGPAADGAPPRGDAAGGGGPGGRAPGAGGGPRGGGFGPPGGGSGATGRWFANLTYSYEIKNKVEVAEGGPVLDALNGESISADGLARHSATARVGLFYDGFGSFLSSKYTGSSNIAGSGLPGSEDLHFNDLVTFDIRLFVDFNQQEKLLKSVPLLKNTRLSFSVDNIFDARQRVEDSTGTVPIRYQPYLVDPVGRFFEIELRKIF
ncbi:conserved hypothetical protein [Altererythrobacter sp. B11]|uniref:TonB-dependent receptor plug domain-containing protein n=1 Tax=Altererythrobacter sp. B11 TaxID=2060312 RepID=UPI000DC7386B|nr:TonB-dependent receptor plug domain-containing protein [Altererythrobacter sp. B11]BBC73796.1 conserved hypothetical protein [Altererythrobacter sp. B11]